MCRRKRRVPHRVTGAAASALGGAGVEPYPRLGGVSIRRESDASGLFDGFPVAAELIPCLARIGSLFGTNLFPVPSRREFTSLGFTKD
jgi:hypothetical protein